MFPYIVQGSNITIVIDSKPYTISKNHITYDKIVDSIKQNDWTKVRDLVEPKQIVLNYGKGNVSVQGNTLYWKNKPMHNALTDRMISMLKDEFPIEPLVNFMENLMQNPSARAVNELYGFLEKNNLPITPDGHFLAYKRVRGDYKDIHSGTMDNSLGKIVEMERNEVDDNRDNTCSHGLHFCSHSYLKDFGGERTVIVKINPRDVVSIPSDYNDAKGRACRYEVVGEVDNDPVDEEEFTKPVQYNANNNTYKPKSETKEGSSPFYRGYTDGYFGESYDPGEYYSYEGRNDYQEGYNKGEYDAEYLGYEKYRYIDTSTRADHGDISFWPHPDGSNH